MVDTLTLILYLIIRFFLTVIATYIICSTFFYIYLTKKKVISYTYWQYIMPWPRVYKEKKDKEKYKVIIYYFWFYLQTDKTFIEEIQKNFIMKDNPSYVMEYMRVTMKEKWIKIVDIFFEEFMPANIEVDINKAKKTFYEDLLLYTIEEENEINYMTLQETKTKILESKDRNLNKLLPRIQAIEETEKLKNMFKKQIKDE